MITSKCPHCQAGIRGDDRFAGRVVACPKCKKQVQMPGSAQPPPPIVPGAVKTPTEPPDSETLIVPKVVPEDVSSATDQEGDDGKAEFKTPALRPCPDCEKMVSRRASQCPNCGCPLGAIKSDATTTKSGKHPTSILQQKPRFMRYAQLLQKRNPKRQVPVFMRYAVVGVIGLVLVVAYLIAGYSIERSRVRTSKAKETSPVGSVVSAVGALLPEPKPGKFRAAVTWQYNKFVGTKPDIDAVVLLVAKGVDTSATLPIDSSARLDESDSAKCGVYCTKVGGDGKAILNRVKPGRYALIIVSHNTNGMSEFKESRAERLKPFFKDSELLGYQNYHQEDIEIVSGDETEVSHDFGNTAY